MKILKKDLKKGSKFCAVVKADAYGHGMLEVVNSIYNDVDSFAVALIDEGVSLRNNGVAKDILVLFSCLKQDLEKAIETDLTLTVSDINQIEDIEEICLRLGKKIFIHVETETGMNREGIPLKKIPTLIEKLKNSQFIELKGVYSHLCRTDEKDFSISQFDKFLKHKELFENHFQGLVYHISASGGYLLGQEFHLDMVRFGIIMYGYNFSSVKPISRFLSKVLASKNVEKDENIGYGKNLLNSNTQISVLRLGYADGFYRLNPLNNKNGKMCMDVSFVESESNANDDFIIEDLQQLAENSGTIVYEILTSICWRAEKRYIK